MTRLRHERTARARTGHTGHTGTHNHHSTHTARTALTVQHTYLTAQHATCSIGGPLSQVVSVRCY